MGMMSTNSTDLIDLVKTFQDRVNQHNVDKIMSMYTEDATFEIVGLSKFAGKQNVKIIFEYDVGVNTKVPLDVNYKLPLTTIINAHFI